MKTHEFFGKYANTPMNKRFVILDMNKLGTMTLSAIHKRMTELEDRMRPMKIEEDELLEVAEKFLKP